MTRRIDWPAHIILSLGVALFVVPIWLVLSGSTLTAAEISRGELSLIPRLSGLGVYASVLMDGSPGAGPVWRMLLVSGAMALAIAVGKIAISILSAYAITFFRFPFRMAAFWTIFITLMLPVEVRIIPTYSVMSDLGLVRYLGYAELPEAAALKQRLMVEQGAQLEHGVHLIVAQGADGGLIVGDSHHYGDLPPPFAPAGAEEDILDEFTRAFGHAPPPVIERWTGVYSVPAEGDSRTFLIETPEPHVRLVIVTSGTGASTGFGIAERVIADLFNL